LREASFKRGHAARSLIGHMHGSVVRLGEDRFLLMVFRSMAATLVHEVVEAMEIVTARG
jgi:sarcosine oxidase subunit gamma